MTLGSFFYEFHQKKITNECIFQARFKYYSLVWKLHSRKLNNRISKLHEGRLRIIFNNSLCTFHELFELDNSVSIHHKNLQCLTIELYQIYNSIFPDIKNDVPIKAYLTFIMLWIDNCFKPDLHCAKSVRIGSYFRPHFPAFGLNIILSKCGKMRTRIIPNTETFRAML